MKRITVLTLQTALLALWTVAVFGLIPSAALGAVPQLINFQGQLKDGSGNPVTDGSHTMMVKIYDAASGTNPPLWSDNFTVATSGGLFTVNLGSGAPLPAVLFSNANLWVGVAVGADPEATPRTQLTSVPYSARVGTVDGATGGVISGDVSIQSNLSVDGGLNGKSMALGTITPGPPQVTPFVLQGAPGQTANLMEIKDDLGAILGSVDSKGSLFHRYGVFAHSVSCGETLSVDQLIATPAIQLKSFSPTDNTISNFPNPVPIKIETGMGSMFIGRSDGVLQQLNAATGASVSKLTEWKNGAGATVASIEPSGTGTFAHELGHNLSLCHNPPVGGFKFLECKDATGNPVASIDMAGNMSLDGDMDGINSTWETGNFIDINCNGTLDVGSGINTNGDVNVGGDVGIGVAIAKSKLDVGGAISTAVTVVNSPNSITLDASHSIVLCNVVLSPITINLPTAAGIAGRVYTIKIIFYNFGSVIIDPFGSETIEGAATYTLSGLYNYTTIVSDGTKWWIIANN